MKEKLEVGDIIEIPAWETFGLIVDIHSPMYGSEDAQCVMVQESPNSKPRRYHLEPNEFVIV